MVDKTSIVREVFQLPDWYLLSENEENKLFKYIESTRDSNEARLFRAMDCPAYCDEDYCFFCSAYWGDIQPNCSACSTIARD